MHWKEKKGIQNMNKVMGAKLWFLIIILSIIWGASFFFVEIAVDKVGSARIDQRVARQDGGWV